MYIAEALSPREAVPLVRRRQLQALFVHASLCFSFTLAQSSIARHPLKDQLAPLHEPSPEDRI